jgi:hypothetical protein
MALHQVIQRMLLVGAHLEALAPAPVPRPPAELQPMIEATAEAHRRFDQRAIHYGHRYRSGFWAIYLLSAIAVLCAVMPLALGWDSATHRLHSFAAVWAVAEVAVIGSVTAIYWLGQRQDWQGEWLRARTTAELTWYLPLVAPLLDFSAGGEANWYQRLFNPEPHLLGGGHGDHGGQGGHGGHGHGGHGHGGHGHGGQSHGGQSHGGQSHGGQSHGGQSHGGQGGQDGHGARGVDDVAELCTRVEPLARRLLGAAWSDPAFVASYARWAVDILEGQRRYHRGVALKQHALLHRVHSITTALFALTATGAMTHLLIHTLWLSLVTTFFPALAASLHGALAQSEAYRLGSTSERLAGELGDSIDRIRSAVDAGDLSTDVASVKSLIEDAIEGILEEHQDWHMLVRPHHLPLA